MGQKVGQNYRGSKTSIYLLFLSKDGDFYFTSTKVGQNKIIIQDFLLYEQAANK